jgi:RNA polymerase sigma-70 factor (ECF subfamily)
VYQSAWRYSYRLCQSYALAEDVLQEALTEAYLRLAQLRDERAFCGWLLSIVRSKFFRLRQGELRQARLREALGSRTKHSREGPESLTPVLTLLPPPQQEILSLFYLEGLSLAETGMVLGIPARGFGRVKRSSASWAHACGPGTFRRCCKARLAGT